MTKDCMGNIIYSKEELASMGTLDLLEMIPPDCWEETDRNEEELKSLVELYHRDFEPSLYQCTPVETQVETKLYKIDSKYYELFKFLSNFLTTMATRELMIVSDRTTTINQTRGLGHISVFSNFSENHMDFLTIPKTTEIFLKLFKSGDSEIDFPKKGETIVIILLSTLETIVKHIEDV